VRDLRTWGKYWNDAALERIGAGLPRHAQSRPWPMLGMLAIGLVAGAALGGYAMSQRSQMRRLTTYARRMREGLAGMPELEDKPITVTSTPSNHRRKATSEV
jgi:hypothetical protein